MKFNANVIRFALILALFALPCGCALTGGNDSSLGSDLELSVGDRAFAGERMWGTASSSHPPVWVDITDVNGTPILRDGLCSDEQTMVDFIVGVPTTGECQEVVITAKDGTGAVVTKHVPVVK